MLTDDVVLMEVAPGVFKSAPRAYAVAVGAVHDRVKEWPTGVRDDVYVLPHRTSSGATRTWSENRGLGGATVHLSEKERKSLETFIGEPVEDAQHARRLMREKGLRFLERGEETERVIAGTIDYAESGGEARGERIDPSCDFGGWDRYRPMPAIKPFDSAGRLAYHLERERRAREENE